MNAPIVVCPVHGLVRIRRDQDPAICPHESCRKPLLEFPDQVEAALSLETLKPVPIPHDPSH
jgi:hypothetical protein